jgi:hypothetical protein
MGSKLQPALSHGLQIEPREDFSKMKRLLEISAINPASFMKGKMQLEHMIMAHISTLIEN